MKKEEEMVTLKRIKQDGNKGKCKREIIKDGRCKVSGKKKKYKDQQIQYKKRNKETVMMILYWIYYHY